MSSNRRVENISNGFRMKPGAARRAIEACSVRWVDEGVSVRNLTLAESIVARNVQAKNAEPMPFAEVHGLRFEPSVSGTDATRREASLLWQAHDFVTACST